MKVLFIHNTLPEYRIKFWELLGKKIDLTVMILDMGLEEKIYGFNKDFSSINIVVYKSLSDLNSIRNFDIVILPPCDSFKLFIINLLILFKCNMYSKQKIYWTEKWEAQIEYCSIKKKVKNFIQRILIHFVCKKSTKCIAAGTCSYNYLLSIGIKKEKLFIAYDSSFIEKKIEVDIYKEHNIPRDKKIILYFGRIIQRKGVLLLLEAFSKMNDDVFLLIAGEGAYLQRCIDYVSEKNMKNVLFVKKIQPEKRYSYFKNADVFCLPSYPLGGVVEAWGLTVNESLCCGTPVISTNAVGAAYDLLDDTVGTVLKDYSIDSLINALRQWTTYKKNEEIEVRCSSKYNQYSIENMANMFYEVVK